MNGVLDHLVYAAPDLAAAVAAVAAATGVEPVPGGSHVGLGTANYLLGLGAGGYLEIIGPDPAQPAPPVARPFGIDALDGPRLVTWALRSTDLDGAVQTARAAGYDPGPPHAMSRRTPDGELLAWRLTDARFDYGDGLVPFLIDWGSTPHPTSRGLPALQLLELRAVHPDPASVRPALNALASALPAMTALPIELGTPTALRATVRAAASTVTL